MRHLQQKICVIAAFTDSQQQKAREPLSGMTLSNRNQTPKQNWLVEPLIGTPGL